MNKKILVIGGVAAGPKTACRVKRLLPDAEVTVIDQDSLISYGGCGIPYFVSGDVSDEKELRSTSFHVVRDETFFHDAKGVTMLTRTRALAIDRQNKTVKVESLVTGEQQDLPYDNLVLATGSSPNRLQIHGADLQGVYFVKVRWAGRWLSVAAPLVWKWRNPLQICGEWKPRYLNIWTSCFPESLTLRLPPCWKNTSMTIT
jgi:NADH dehydrogenase FAD-containing subunit